MRRIVVGVVSILAGAGTFGTCVSEPPRDLSAVRVQPTDSVSMARDTEGLFGWVKPGKRPAFIVTGVDPSIVTFRHHAGELDVETGTTASDGRTILIRDPTVLSVDDRITVYVGEQPLTTHRLRTPTPTNGGTAFFEAVAAADALFRPSWAKAGDAWIAIGRSKGIDAQGERSRVLRAASWVRTRQLRYDEVPPLLAEAGRLARLVDDPVSAMRIKYYEANLYYASGVLLRALRLYDEAMELALAAGKVRDASIYRKQKAVLLADLGRFGEALALVEEALRGLNESQRLLHDGDVAQIRRQAMFAGVLDMDLEAIGAAYERLIAEHERASHRGYAVEVLSRRIGVDLDLGDVKAARAGLEILETRQADLAEALVPGVELLHARLETLEERYDAGAARLRGLVADDPESGTACDALSLHGELEWHRGRSKESIELHRLAVACFERNSKRFSTVGSAAQFLHAKRSIHTRLARRLIDAGRTTEAFRVVDRARAIVLEQRVQAIDIDAHATAWLVYRTAQARADQLAAEGCATMVKKASRRACAKEIREAKREAAAERASFQAAIPPRPTIVRDDEWMARIRQVLGAKEKLLMVVGHCADARHLLVDRSGVSLAADVASQLTDVSHLYIVPDWHPESFDPFDVQVDGEPLAARLQMSFIPHANILLRPFEPSARDGRIVIADPDGTLPDSAAEGVSIEKLLGAKAIVGDAASHDRVLDAWRQASVLHYVGHAEAIRGDPWSVRLRLANHERFGVIDALVDGTSPDLLVLNGCATGPALRAGGGGLPAAMVQSGARAVLATVHAQDDGAATAFVHDFYEAGGIDAPAEAYRQAVIRAVHRGDDGWRPFRLWGPAFDNRPDQPTAR